MPVGIDPDSFYIDRVLRTGEYLELQYEGMFLEIANFWSHLVPDDVLFYLVRGTYLSVALFLLISLARAWGWGFLFPYICILAPTHIYIQFRFALMSLLIFVFCRYMMEARYRTAAMFCISAAFAHTSGILFCSLAIGLFAFYKVIDKGNQVYITAAIIVGALAIQFVTYSSLQSILLSLMSEDFIAKYHHYAFRDYGQGNFIASAYIVMGCTFLCGLFGSVSRNGVFRNDHYGDLMVILFISLCIFITFPIQTLHIRAFQVGIIMIIVIQNRRVTNDFKYVYQYVFPGLFAFNELLNYL